MLSLLLAESAPIMALALSEHEVRMINGLCSFLDNKPEGAALRSIETAMKSENPALRGLAALILFRHYGESFRGQLLRNFTLNPAVDRFVAEKKVLVKIENVDRLLAGYSGLLARFKDERARRLDRGRKMAALPDGDLPVLAPIPGLVVKVLVAEGDVVEENQPMVLLEAMKMENELRAQKAGKVKQVKIVAGQRVEQNALLMLLE